MTTRTAYKYKCRMCNKKFQQEVYHEWDIANESFLFSQGAISMIEFHKCSESCFGIGDLLGGVKKKLTE